MKRTSDQAAILFISKALTAGLLFALGPILVRKLDQAQYGTFLQINLITSLFVAILPCGIPQAISFFVPRIDPSKHFRFVTRTLTALFLLGSVGVVVIWAGKNYIGQWMNNPQLVTLAPYIGALIIVTILIDTTETIFLAYNRSGVVGIVLPIKAIARVVGVVLPLQLERGLTGALEGLIIVGIAESLILYGYHVVRSSEEASGPSGVSIAEQLRYAFPVGIIMIVGILGSSIDKFIVSSMFTPAQYALYARGAFELPLVGILPGMLFDLLLPKFSQYLHEGGKGEVLRLTSEAIRRTALAFYPICALCVVLADPLITFLFTDAYTASVPIFQVYVLLMLFQVAPLQIIFRATGNNFPYLRVTLLRIVLGAALTTGLLKLIGPIGAALAVVIIQAIVTLLCCVLAGHELNEPWKQLVPWNDLARTFVLSACIAVMILPITWLTLPKWAILILGGGVFSLLFIFFAFYLRRISEMDKEILTRWAALVVRP
ncbi:MAG: hypothetical protein A4E19_20925 [Nitrospira sp. SG-bin1]|nr:MAG: hypothetical protein A4E19_20925 [Nitrospira sp. SG-bin1]